MFCRVILLFSVLFLSVIAQPSFAAHAVAAAEVFDKMQYYWIVNQPSKKLAQQKIMRICSDSASKNKHTAGCKLVGGGDGSAYIAFFHTKDGRGFGVAWNADRQQSIDHAYANCLKQGECPETAASVVFDEGEQQSRPMTRAAAGGNCRPRTREISCRSNCINGNCVVEYENGCKMNVQVAPRFDPFTNQWTYPAPSC